MGTLLEEPSSLTKSYKFIRRADIDSELRLKIGILGFFFKHHGQVTKISSKYSVCRTFIYGLIKRVETRLDGLFEESVQKNLTYQEKRNESIRKILEFRMIGKCSLDSISEFIGISDASLPNSTCFISKTLKDLGSKSGKMVAWKGSVYYASDEIYMIGHQPVLVTVDPVSSTILRMELLESLTKEAWENHWQALRDAGIESLGLVKDEGILMKAAHESSHSDIAVQTDSFHAISHRLGIFVARLEKKAEKAIEKEWKQEGVAQRAVSERVKVAKLAKYQKACEQTIEAIEQYEQFQFLYSCIYTQLNCFDYQYNARSRVAALAEMQCALAWMKQLDIPKLDKEIKAIEKLLPNLFDFLLKAEQTQSQLEQELGKIPAYFWIYAWQNDKKSRKMKHNQKAKHLKIKVLTALELLREHYKTQGKSDLQFDALKKYVFDKLDNIIQSSALVETINSLLRPYMDSARNQISQEQLNLIRFYLNHRVYKRGKRQGFSPFELLSGTKIEKNWVEQLLDKVG
jgi:hypothetical protein